MFGISRGLYDLSYQYSAAGFPRHSAVIGVIKRVLQKAPLLSVLQFPGLGRDRPRSDSVAVFPLSRGRSLVWDCTCVDFFYSI